MNELQREKIERLLEDEVLLGALDKVFSEVIEKYRPNVNKLEPDDVLGANYRAYSFAKTMLNECFAALQGHRKGEKDTNNKKSPI